MLGSPFIQVSRAITLLLIVVLLKCLVLSASKFEITKEGCGISKSCYSSIASCHSSSDCRFLAIYSVDGADIIISLSAKGDYTSIGFGHNNRMPSTDAIACLKSDNGVIVIQQYWITEYDDPKVTTPMPSKIELLDSSYEDGVVKCRFSRPTNPVGISSMLNLSSTVYVVFASGPIENENGKVEVDYHSFTAFTLAKVNVSMPTNLNVVYGRNAGIKAHAILMSFAWVACATVGVFLARFMRGAWPQQKLFGTKIWFQLHRGLMFCTALLTIAAFITIFVTIGEFSTKATAHAVIGILVLILVTVQPIMAAMRPVPGDSKRPIFNWVHRGVGLLGLTLSTVNIFLGVSMPEMGMGSSGVYAMIIYVILIVLVVCFDVFLYRIRKNDYTRFETEQGEVEIQTTSTSVEDKKPRLVMLAVVVVTTLVIFSVLLGLSISDDD